MPNRTMRQELQMEHYLDTYLFKIKKHCKLTYFYWDKGSKCTIVNCTFMSHKKLPLDYFEYKILIFTEDWIFSINLFQDNICSFQALSRSIPSIHQDTLDTGYPRQQNIIYKILNNIQEYPIHPPGYPRYWIS